MRSYLSGHHSKSIAHPWITKSESQKKRVNPPSHPRRLWTKNGHIWQKVQKFFCETDVVGFVERRKAMPSLPDLKHKNLSTINQNNRSWHYKTDQLKQLTVSEGQITNLCLLNAVQCTLATQVNPNPNAQREQGARTRKKERKVRSTRSCVQLLFSA